MPEPLLSMNQARVIVGALKGVKRVSYKALVRLVKQEGLPIVPNPFSPGIWAFQKTAILEWFQEYTNPTAANTLRGSGRPKKKG